MLSLSALVELSMVVPGLETVNKVSLPSYLSATNYLPRAAFAQALSALTALRDFMAGSLHWTTSTSLLSVNCLPNPLNVCGSIESQAIALILLGRGWGCCQTCLHLLRVRHGLYA